MSSRNNFEQNILWLMWPCVCPDKFPVSEEQVNDCWMVGGAGGVVPCYQIFLFDDIIKTIFLRPRHKIVAVCI